MSMKEPDAAVETTTGAASDDEIEGSDVRNALNAAFDAAEGAESEESTEVAAAPAKGAETATTKDTDTADTSTEVATAQTAKTDAAAPAKTYVQGEAISAAIVAGEWDKVDLTRPPSSLSVEAKAKFASLDEPLRKEFLRLDANFHKGIEQYKADAGVGKEILKIAEPYLPMIQAEGGTPAGAFRDLLNTAYQLRQNPQAVIEALVKKYGYEPAKEGSEAAVAPEIAALKQELAELKGTFTAGEQEAKQQLRQAADEQLSKFASDPKNVYFSDVRAQMASLVQSGEAKDIQDAYDKACWMNPQIRAAMTQQEIDKREKERIAEVKRKAADAKRASFDVSGSGAATSGKSELSLRDQLEAAFPQ